ncbi:MAG: hypothetical protein KGR19_08640, partial [Acidobacteria bacterium]|nr:hypothetical protein [Acidobacteriota bacterium]
MRALRLLPALLIAALAVLPSAASADVIGTLGPQQQLTTFNPSYAAGWGAGVYPDVAYNSSSKKTMAVWVAKVPVSGSAPLGGMIQTAFLNGDAGLASAPVDVSTTLPTNQPNQSNPPSVAAGPNGTWLVLWVDDNREHAYGQVLDASGAPSGPNFEVSTTTFYNVETVTAAWSPADQRYLVTWSGQYGSSSGDQQIVGRFLDPAGSPIGGEFLVTNTPDKMDNSQYVAYGNGRWIAVGTTKSNDRPVGQVVTAAGPQGSLIELSSAGYVPSNNLVAPRISYNAFTGQFAAVFKQNNSPYSHYVRLLDGSGVPLGSDGLVSNPGGTHGSIASAGKYGYMVAWQTQSSPKKAWAQRLLPDGTLNGAPIEVNEPAPFDGWRPAVAYDASLGKYMIVYGGRPGSSAPNNIVNVYGRTFVENLPPNEMTVAKDGTGSGTITSSPAGIDCGSTCTFGFDSGASVTLTASAASGSKFAGWGGACSGTAPTCTVTMDAARSVTATFTADSPTPPSPSNSFSALSAAPGSSVVTVGRVPGAG